MSYIKTAVFSRVLLSVTVKWLAIKTVSEMTYTVSGGALNSIQSNPFSRVLRKNYSPMVSYRPSGQPQRGKQNTHTHTQGLFANCRSIQ